MESSTKILRRMLDERDEYYKTSGNKTWWGRPIDKQTGKPINVFHYQAQPMGEDRLFVELQLATPEQAIAATLGAGTCHDKNGFDPELGLRVHGLWRNDRRLHALDCGHGPLQAIQLLSHVWKENRAMSITDELREWGCGFCGDTHDVVTAIADRVDAAVDGMIELPKDADGEYIRVGDRLDGYGKTIEVVEMRHGRSGWVLISRDGNGYADTFAFTHHHAPTVEDVLCDLLNEYRENECTLEEARLSEYATRLRLAEVEDA